MRRKLEMVVTYILPKYKPSKKLLKQQKKELRKELLKEDLGDIMYLDDVKIIIKEEV